jgi:hypothetical protein
MPRLNLADALRYFFSPIAFVCYLLAYDSNLVARSREHVNFLGTVVVIASGVLIYLLYRFFLYDGIILWLHDVFRKSNYRIYIQSRYMFPKSKFSPASTRLASKIFGLVNPNHFGQPIRKVRAAAIHFLYQAGLLVAPFLVLSIAYKGFSEILLFSALFIVLLWAAVGFDMRFEDEELVLLKQLPKGKLDRIAKEFGLEKRSITGSQLPRRDVGSRSRSVEKPAPTD